MKAIIILVNWTLSFVGLSVDTETTPLWIVMLLLGWFIGSSLILNYANRRGWMDKIIKYLKIDEL